MNQKIHDALLQRGGKPLNILVVDDEASVRDVLRDFCLSTPLFKVTTASGGQEALELVQQNEFDIITVDLVMPEMSGLEAIEMIKRQKPHLPVVIVTGNATESLIREAGRLGGCRVMRKPLAINDFIDGLAELALEKCRK